MPNARLDKSTHEYGGVNPWHVCVYGDVYINFQPCARKIAMSRGRK